MANTIIANVLPADVTITNSSTRTKVLQLFRVNIRIKLAPEDKIILRAVTSEQSIYYQSLAGDGFTVVVAAVENGDDA